MNAAKPLIVELHVAPADGMLICGTHFGSHAAVHIDHRVMGDRITETADPAIPQDTSYLVQTGANVDMVEQIRSIHNVKA